jgi:hypothetical protein
MPDSITRLNAALEGRYRIERQLGEGGMATVYLAEDLRHDRKVALKVLKPELAAVVGADRFLAEIKTTANLQHPHILPLFDSGEADSFLFYVMPYVEGESLRERLDREHQLPVDEAVRIATDVAEALHVAHEQGIVHRDIKPANILLSRGRPLVADFGIALAVSAAGGGRLTETGLSMGTPYYMSPEQASADREASAASDVYSLGCVLYEMLVGEPPHTGGSAQAVLAKILMDEAPAPTRTRPSIPTNVDAAIRKSLEKLPADRFTGAQELASALADPGFRYGEVTAGGPGAGRGLLTPPVMMAGGLGLVLGLVAGWAVLRPATEPARRVERFAVPFLEGQEHSGFPGSNGSDLSPDGSMLVYRFNTPVGQILMVRRWDDLNAVPVRESDGGTSPAVSFDGLELAFSQGREIKVLALAGGPVRTLLTGTQPEWGPDGYVYATTDSGTVRVPSTGGDAELVSSLAEGESQHIVRDVLPGGESVLLEVVRSDGSTEMRGLDLRSGNMTMLGEGSLPRYVSTGHLVFNLQGSIMAVRFDPNDMEVLGVPVAVIAGVGYFTLADDGKLYYTTDSGSGEVGGSPQTQLAWVEDTGDPAPVDPVWTVERGADPWLSWSVSPNGSMIALREFTSSGYDIWVKHLERGPRSRLTLDPAHEKMPVWRPGTERVTFLSDRGGNFDVWERAANGTGQAELILDLEEDLATVRWSPDGQWLLLGTAGPDGDILAYRPDTDGAPTPLFQSTYNEREPAASPDGRWIAYTSDQSGRNEVFVAPFPEVSDGRWQVSINSGRVPRWAPDGRRLFFDRDGQGQPLMSVEVETDPSFTAGTPEVFRVDVDWAGSAQTSTVFDVAPEGRRLLVGIPPSSDAGTGGDAGLAPSRILVNNFFEELKQAVPVD